MLTLLIEYLSKQKISQKAFKIKVFLNNSKIPDILIFGEKKKIRTKFVHFLRDYTVSRTATARSSSRGYIWLYVCHVCCTLEWPRRLAIS